jgi:superfamily II DNA/RNA helicase
VPRNNFDDRDDSADFQMNDSAESRPLTFGELGVPGPLVRVLAADDKKTAFPIQADTLPDSLAGRDILGRGRTGSGKTLAFSIPLVTRLGSYDSFGEIAMEEFRKEIKRRKKASLEERRADDFLPHPRGLVLAPTRELANQINDVLMPLAHTFGMNTTTVYGGVKYIHQIRDLKAGADIVVACPGRLEDLLRQQALTLSSVEVVVIDEADEMADMGFLPPVKRLLEQISPDAQHMLFSATLDHGVDEVVNTFLHDPKVHEVDSATTEPDLMTHHVPGQEARQEPDAERHSGRRAARQPEPEPARSQPRCVRFRRCACHGGHRRGRPWHRRRRRGARGAGRAAGRPEVLCAPLRSYRPRRQGGRRGHPRAARAAPRDAPLAEPGRHQDQDDRSDPRFARSA